MAAEPAVLKRNLDETISYNKQILAAATVKDDDFLKQMLEAVEEHRS